MSYENKRTTIKSLTLVNFKGIFFKTLSMHHLMSNLIGHNGAGKTTVMGALLINRVPDNRLIRLRNNSDSGSDRSDNGIWGRIEQGICYTVVDFERYDGERIVAVVQLKRLGKPRVEIRLSAITGIDHEMPVRDLLMKPSGDGRYEPLEGRALKNHIALLGGNLENFKSLGLYMAWQFDNRILPRRMDNSQDRQRYYRMLETSLYGGLSSELQKGLRDYLLPTDSNVRTSVSSMQNALQETRNTRQQIESSRSKREFIKCVLESSYALGEHSLALAEQQHTDLQQQLQHAQQQHDTLELELEAGKQQIAALEQTLGQLNITRDQLNGQEEEYRTNLDHARELDRLHREHRQLSNEITNLTERLNEQYGHQALLLEQHARQSDVVAQLEEDLISLVKQLASAEQAYSEEARKAGLYQEAVRSLDEARQLLNEPALDKNNLASFLQDIITRRESLLDSYHSQQPLLEQMEHIREQFDRAQSILQAFDDSSEQVISDDTVAELTDQWLQTGRERRLLANNQQHCAQQLHNLQQQNQRRKTLVNDLSHLPESWRTSITSVDSWLATLSQAKEQQSGQTDLKESCDFQLHDDRVREMQCRSDWKQAVQDHHQWSQFQQLHNSFQSLLPDFILVQADDLNSARQHVNTEQLNLNRLDVQQEEQLKTTRLRLRGLEQLESEEDSQFQHLAELTGAEIVSRYFDDDDISIEEAAWLEAKMGPLRQALMVRDIEAAADIIRNESDRPEHVWLMQGEARESFSEDDYIKAPANQPEDGSVLVSLSNNIARISKEPEFPTIGRLAREKERHRLVELEEQLLDERQLLAVKRKRLQQASSILDKLAAVTRWLDEDEPPVRELEAQLSELENTIHSLTQQQKQLQQQLKVIQPVVQFLEHRQSEASLLELDHLDEDISALQQQLALINDACEWLSKFNLQLNQLEQLRLYLDKPPVESLEEFRQQLKNMQAAISLLGKKKDQLQNTEQKLPYLRYKESETRKNETSDLQQKIKQEWEEKDSRKRLQQQELGQLSEQLQALEKNISNDETMVKRNEGEILLKQNEMNDIPLEWSKNLVEEQQHNLDQLLAIKYDHERSVQEGATQLADQKIQQKQRTEAFNGNTQKLEKLEPISSKATKDWQTIHQHAVDAGLYNRLHKQHLQEHDKNQLVTHIANARATLQNALQNGLNPESNARLHQQISETETSDLPTLFQLVSAAQTLLNERMDKSLAAADDPLLALSQLEDHLTKLETRLKDAESRFLAESGSMGRNIEQKINMQRRQIIQLNSALSSVHFGTIRAIKVELEVIETHEKVLNALQSRFYGDLFKQSELSIEDALAEIFKKETGGSITGERLLDYREYIRLKVLIKRAGSTQFEPANPTNLSTGEAIGTGLAVLTMVLHSWEVATQRNHQRGHCANRLLFLDEAARLDARALATLEELCENQSLQLLIGAPDNVQPKNGVTYRMVRLMEPHEHVIFSAVRGKLPTGETA